MPIKSRNILKSYFENGDKPNELEFIDLIDSFIHISEGVSNGTDGTNGTGGTGGNNGTGGTYGNSGIVTNVATNNNGDIVLTYSNGDVSTITNTGSVGASRRPILFKKAYDKIYFVSEEKGDDDTAVSNSFRFYKSIVRASEEALSNFENTGNKNLVFVFKGTYNEESVNRNHVDLHFEDGTVVWTEGTDSSIINDKLEAITDANVYGKGTFLNKQYDPYDDREGINMRRASSMYIEAKLVDGIQLYKDFPIHFEFANMDILYTISSHRNKSMRFTNCRFLNGFKISSFRKEGGKEVFENCEFIVPKYATTDSRNKNNDILDYKGDFLFRVVYNDTNGDQLDPIEDTTILTQEAIFTLLLDEYTEGRRGSTPGVSCIMYSENYKRPGWRLGDYKLEIRNSKCIIKRENSYGLILLKRKDSNTTEGHVILDNLIIVDETETKNSAAIVSGWGADATRQPGLMLNAISHNCKQGHIKISPELNIWEATFKNIIANKKTIQTGIVGQVTAISTSTIPKGWLQCDGSSLVIAEYPDLYQSIGKTYGGDDTTFKLPNLTERTIIGIGDVNEGATTRTISIAEAGGEKEVTLTLDQLPEHDHSVAVPASDEDSDSDSPEESIFGASTNSTNIYSSSESNFEMPVFESGKAGSGEPHTNMQPYLALNYIICYEAQVVESFGENITANNIEVTGDITQNGNPIVTLNNGKITEKDLPEHPNTALTVYGADNKIRKDLKASVILASPSDHNTFNQSDIYLSRNDFDYSAYGYGEGSFYYITIKEQLFKQLFEFSPEVRSNILPRNASGLSDNRFIITISNKDTHYSIYVVPNFKATANSEGYISLGQTVSLFDLSGLPPTGGDLIDIDLEGCSIYAQSIGLRNNILDKFVPRTGGGFTGYISVKKPTELRPRFSVENDNIFFRAGNGNSPRANMRVRSSGWDLRNNPISGDYATGLTVQSNSFLNDESYFDVPPSTSEDKNLHYFRMPQAWSFFSVGMGIGGLKGSSYVHEVNDNVVFQKGYAKNLRVKDKFRILNSAKDTANEGIPLVKLSTGEIVEGNTLKVSGDVHANGTYYYGDNKQVIKFDDAWLRLNPSGQFTSGVYCGNKTLRTDGEFQIGGNGSIFKVETNGNIITSGNISGASDIRLKKEIKSINKPFLEKINKLEPKFYKWKDAKKEQKEQLGFIAQEVEKVFPEWVSESNDTKAISYDKMGAVVAVQGIKELKSEIELLKKQISELKSIINEKNI